jgi:hypothetical protein
VWAQQTATKAVTISVSDPTGANISHSQIRLVPTPDSAPAKLEADSQGHNAPTGKELHGESLATYLLATGMDGYSVVLSLAEADPSFHDGQILVADVRDGQPLGKNGPFQLIVTGDKRPARWVHNLDSIALQSAH